MAVSQKSPAMVFEKHLSFLNVHKLVITNRHTDLFSCPNGRKLRRLGTEEVYSGKGRPPRKMFLSQISVL